MKKLIILGVACLMNLTACRQDFDEINTNPNATDKPITTGLFNAANRNLAFNTRDTWASGRLALPWVQYSAQVNYTEEDRYQYRESTTDNLWRDLYHVANNYKKIIDLNTDPATKDQMAIYGPNHNQIAAARIMLSYVFSLLADSFGDVPYWSYGNQDPDFQALKAGQKNLTPKFASQEKIYEDILKELKEASDMITMTDIVFVRGDVLFVDGTGKSSGAKMKKFANSLRLRMAMRVKGVLTTANTHIAEAIASGVMTSNADNVGVPFENNKVNPSPLYAAFMSRTDFAISKPFTELLKGNHTTVFPGKSDPRLLKYAAPIGLTAKVILAGNYTEPTNPNDIQGMPYGLGKGVPDSQLKYSSLFSKNILKQDYTEILMEYSEVEFLLSEHDSWNQTNYENGVKASMEKWGVPAAEITTFITGLPGASQGNVLTQKYIALFMQPYEAWAEYRRTGYPKTLLLPGQTAFLNSPSTTPYTFVSLVSYLTDLPTRLRYPMVPKNTNGTNCQAAVNKLVGGDKMDSKLIWIP